MDDALGRLETHSFQERFQVERLGKTTVGLIDPHRQLGSQNFKLFVELVQRL
jgi:hypothetical protein